MSFIYVLLSIIFILGCGALVTIILMQKKRSSGLGSIAGMGNSQTYFDRNKGRTLEGTLEKFTKIGGVALFLFSILLCVIR